MGKENSQEQQCRNKVPLKQDDCGTHHAAPKRRRFAWGKFIWFVLVVYAVLYFCKYFELNRGNYIRWHVSELSPSLQKYVEIYPEDNPEDMFVVGHETDLDGDGIFELVMDGGPNIRGAANSTYTVLRRTDTGKYESIGELWFDTMIWLPSWKIWGYPYAWCMPSGRTPSILHVWNGERYEE